ncbi:hypothetical protein [Anaerosalibacter sp. Marseille-P3206]|uniref:hypothetical protein n=1 Tax=Anaerosalibacter sp. Marseille-P3206 TaxID=1871005 RepID=UPI0009860224|nr:hypothetical protein [Anaerosalibacter sp. Marseille-P3206]
MDKRIVSILLIFVMMFGGVASLAAEGDIIHTEHKKIYRKNNSSEQEELVNDIVNGFAVDKFFRETSDGMYVNIKEEEDAQFEALAKIVQEKGLKTAEEIREYILNNSTEMNKIMDEAKKNVPHVSIDTKEYQGATNAPLLTEKNFSNPEPGYKEGTTKITTLNLPSDASSWRIQVLDSPVEPMRKDYTLKEANSYVKDKDIEVGVGKYLILYAVDSSNRIKAYANIKITNEMIKQPREEALKLEIGSIKAGSSYAGTVVVSGLDKLPEGATKWQVVASNTPLDKLYKGDKLSEAVDYVNGEITVADENELVNMNDSFKKYVILIAANNDGKTVGYRIFEVGKDNISKAPTLLKENTNYVGPVPGSEDGTTVFTKLSFEDNTEWKIKISDDKPKIPALDSKADGTPYSFEEDSKNIKIKPKQYLMLLATIDGKIKGYKIFEVNENQVKGLTATEIKDNTIKLGKGSIEGTTKVVGLNLTNINGATKWMYVVGKDLSAPMLDKLVDGSMNYTPENDIKVAIDDNLIILATDDEGKVKAYVKFELTSDVIKDPAPILLKENVDFTSPVKGSTKGTTKIKTLAPTIAGINHWRYKTSSKPFDIPEIDTMVDGSEELTAGKDIGKDLTGNEYIIILATVKDTENKYATKGYATFQLSEKQVYMGEATNLISDDDKWKDNISQPEPGSIGDTTKIATLNTLGLPGGDTVNEWRYKVLQEKIETPIEFNSKIDRTTKYNTGNNIRVNVGDNLLIVATDRFGNIKAYAQFKIEPKNVRSPNAPLLIGGTNYKIQGPEPGSMENSTKFSYLDFSTNVVGATKWMYGIGNQSFGPIEYDSVLKEAKEYTVTDNIGKDIENVSEGKYLLLLATDNDNKVKAYKEFRLTLDQIKGTKAKILASDTNYIIEKGDKPGTTKFSKLDPIGAAGASNWKYKLIETEEKIQIENNIYTNYIVKDTIGYTSGRDIPVKEINKDEPKYGYILLLATDSNGRTKGYAIIDVKSDVVKEHAERLDVKLAEGDTVDTVKVVKEGDSKFPATGTYKKLVTKTVYPTPAKGEILKTGDEYKGEDISVFVGDYVTIFEVNDNNEIQKFNSMEVTKDDINSVEATLTGDSTSSNTLTIPEDRINSGGQKITITLDDGATWEDLKKDKAKRDTLYNSFRPSNQSTEWTKVVTKLIDDGGTLTIDDKTLSFFLPMTEKYDISEDQEITLTIPATCVTGARNNIDVKGNIIIKPIVEATIKGDVVSSIVRQKDLKAGGKSIIIELGDGEWIGDIADKKDTLFDCFKVIGEDGKVVTTTTEWSKIVGKLKSSSEPNTIIRNSSKMVTITLPEVMDVDLGTSYETIKLTIPKDKGLILGATSDIVAMPTFKIYPDILKVEGKVVDEKNTVTMMAPDYRIVETDKDTWIIDVNPGTLKDDIDNNDVVITGLPRGLKSNVSKVEDKNQIRIKISDTASSTLANDTEVKIKIKGTAVTEPNSIDSDDIVCMLVKGESIIEDLKKVGINVAGKILTSTSEEMQYSLDSTNGSDGDWNDCSTSTETEVSEGFGPGRVYVRDKSNNKVFHLVATLNYPKAPTGVSISEVNYDTSDSMKVKIGIKEPATDGYEVSTDGGKNWGKLDLDNGIDLTNITDPDLRIRCKATASSLHSLDTKINILDLSNVDINVAKGVITNTTTAMEYSLDGDTFYSARANETSVKFEKGSKVVVREKANRVNEREVKVVGIENSPSGTDFNILGGTISATSPGRENIQYRIGNDPWKDLSTDNKKIEFKPGKVQVRTKATKYNVASEPVDVGKEPIKEPASKPELRVDDYKKDISYWNGNQFVELESVNTLEYKINDGDWKSNAEWSGDKTKNLIKNTNANVSVRIKATKDALPSQATVVNFTGNLTWENVKLNVVEGKIEGTTTAMQYSTNSTDGKNGTWIDANSGSTSVDFAKDMKVYIREKSKPLNFKNLIEKIDVETVLDKNKVDYDILSGTITNKDIRIIEYRIGNDAWELIDRGSEDKPSTTNVEFKPGKLQFRARGTEKTLPSDIITVDIKAKASAPELKYDDVNYKIEKVGTDEGKNYEYSINGGTWINGTVDTQFEGGNTVKVRIIANSHTLPSQEQTIKFTSNLDLNNVVLNVGESKLVNTSTLMEYSTNSTNGEDGTWVSCNGTETTLRLKEDMKVYVREKAKPRNVKLITTKKIEKKKFTNSTDFIKDNIDYNILQGTISIKDSNANTHQEIVNNLQYRINNGNWVNIDYVVLGSDTNKVLAYNVNFVPGNLEFRLKGNENTLPSDSILKDVIKAPASAPNVSVGFDSTKYRNNVTTGVNLTTLEYSLTGDKGPWIDGEHLDTEDLVREVYIRTKATKDALPSLAKKLTFTPVLNLKTINLSTHVQPLELNGTTTQMEYAVKTKDGKLYEQTLEDGTTVNWFNCQEGNTPILKDIKVENISEILVRDNNQQENQYTVYKKTQP